MRPSSPKLLALSSFYAQFYFRERARRPEGIARADSQSYQNAATFRLNRVANGNEFISHSPPDRVTHPHFSLLPFLVRA